MKEQAFYKQPILTWFLLFVYPPIGIISLWVFRHYDILWRILLSFLFGLIYLEFIGLYSSLIRAFIYSLIVAYLIWRYLKINEYKEHIQHFYNSTLENDEIRNIIISFITQYEPPTHSFQNYLDFELTLRHDYPILYQHQHLSHKEDLFINFIYQESELFNQYEYTKEEKTEYDKELIINLSNIIKKKLKLDGERFPLYLTWELIKDISLDYYHNQFINDYGSLINTSTLDEAIFQYVSVDALNPHKNAHDLALFTHYLMKEEAFDYNDDFLFCLTTVAEEIAKQMKKRQFTLFEKRLLQNNHQLLKEVETLSIIDQMKTKARFKTYVLDLLKALDYQNIVHPLNAYLDYIITKEDFSYGINLIYQDKKDKKLTSSTIQKLATGLSYNELKKGILITNGTFTKDAKELAEKENIVLWDEEQIFDKSLYVKRFYQNKVRLEPDDEIKIDDITTIPPDQITINEIDLMNGFEFQYYLAYLFKQKGYKLISVLKSKDQGVDIIIERHGLRFGIQAKRHNKVIEKEAIEELISGIIYHQLRGGYVITNNYYTKEARNLAAASDIILWNRDNLLKEIKQIK